MKKIFIITGEYSGDMHAGRVAEILKQKNPDIEIEGIGGGKNILRPFKNVWLRV